MMSVLEGLLNLIASLLIILVTWVYVNKKNSVATRAETTRRDAPQRASNSNIHDGVGAVLKNCSNCHITEGSTKETKFLPCGQCGFVFCCSVDCQRAHKDCQSCILKVSDYSGGGASDTKAMAVTAHTKEKEPKSAASGDLFGTTEAERHELLDELTELSPTEKEALLQSWGQLSPDELGASPTTTQLQASLREHREELASLKLQAAKSPLNEKKSEALVARGLELTEMIALEQELLAMHEAEDIHIEMLLKQASGGGRRRSSSKDHSGAKGARTLSTKEVLPGDSPFPVISGDFRCLPCTPNE